MTLPTIPLGLYSNHECTFLQNLCQLLAQIRWHPQRIAVRTTVFILMLYAGIVEKLAFIELGGYLTQTSSGSSKVLSVAPESLVSVCLIKTSVGVGGMS